MAEEAAGGVCGEGGVMEGTIKYIVLHKRLGTLVVDGANRLEAVQAAAREWKVPWTSIARECEFRRIEGEKE